MHHKRQVDHEEAVIIHHRDKAARNAVNPLARPVTPALGKGVANNSPKDIAERVEAGEHRD